MDPSCPICHATLERPPEDVRDWFRCGQCGTALQVPPVFGRTLFWISTVVVLVLLWVLVFLEGAYFPRAIRNWQLYVYLSGAMTGVVLLALYAWLVRRFWQSGLAHPRPCDPYSSLNLSSDQTKLRGHR